MIGANSANARMAPHHPRTPLAVAPAASVAHNPRMVARVTGAVGIMAVVAAVAARVEVITMQGIRTDPTGMADPRTTGSGVSIGMVDIATVRGSGNAIETGSGTTRTRTGRGTATGVETEIGPNVHRASGPRLRHRGRHPRGRGRYMHCHPSR